MKASGRNVNRGPLGTAGGAPHPQYLGEGKRPEALLDSALEMPGAAQPERKAGGAFTAWAGGRLPAARALALGSWPRAPLALVLNCRPLEGRALAGDGVDAGS